MKPLPAFVLILAAMAAPAALGAAHFEGKVRMKMTDQKNPAHFLDYSVKEGFIRTDIETEPGQVASMIMDLGKHEMLFLMPGQKMYMTRPMPDMNAAAARHADSNADDGKLVKTGETEKILGYDCEKYISKSRDTTTELWITDQLGSFMGLGRNGNPMGGRKSKAVPSWEKDLMDKGGFPMRVISTGKKGEKFRLEVVSVQKATLPASTFSPPADYQKFDLGGMMRGLGGQLRGGK
jgi:hypothetical protein